MDPWNSYGRYLVVNDRHAFDALLAGLSHWRTAICITLLLAACGQELQVAELSGSTMGTTFSVQIPGSAGRARLDALGNEMITRLRDIERSASTYDTGSTLSRFNDSQNVGWVSVDHTLCAIVDLAAKLSDETDGAFDVTIGPLVNLWGFGPGEQRTEPPESAAIDAAMARVDHSQVATDCEQPALRKSRPDIFIDLSAIAKGYAVDELAMILDQEKVESYLVEVGGELRARGLKPGGDAWRVAIERPDTDTREIQQIVELMNRAMATSGDYRNYFESGGERFSHTIDPRTGRPVTHSAAAVTTIHESAAVADAYSTALLVMGPDDGLRFAEESGLAAQFLVRSEGGFETRTTSGFTAALDTATDDASIAHGNPARTSVSVRSTRGLPMQ